MTAEEAALAFLVGASTEEAGRLAEALWLAVVEEAVSRPVEQVRVAAELREVGAEDPLWGVRTVELAGRVLGSSKIRKPRTQGGAT